ncbi:hypothetical protein ABZ756_07080 [Mammaliicoccus sciuri]
MEQLSLFESGESTGCKLMFRTYLCDADLDYRTSENKVLLAGPDLCLTKQQLLGHARKAVKIERFKYGYMLYIDGSDGMLSISARLSNYSTRSGEGAADYFNRCFDDV